MGGNATQTSIPTFSGVPNVKCGEKIRISYVTLAFCGAQKRAELLRNPCICGVPNAKGREKMRSGCVTLAFSGAHKWGEVLASPAFSGGAYAKRGRIENGYVSPVFSGAENRAELLCNPYILKVSNAKTQRKSELAASNLRSQRPTSGRKYS